MPSPEPSPGGAVVAVTIARHPFDTLGYPLHISLVEKLFAAACEIAVYPTAGSFGNTKTATRSLKKNP
jgi:hypothetical protein